MSASRRLGADLGVLATVLAGLGLTQLVLGRGDPAVLIVVGVAEALAALVAAAFVATTGVRHIPAGSVRRSWLLLAAGLASWGLGQVFFAAQDVLGLDYGATTWADLPFFVMAVLLVVSGAVSLRTRVRRDAGIRAALDGALVGGSLLTIVWVVWLGDAIRFATEPPSELVIPLTYPLLDVVFLTIAIISVLRGGLTGVGVLCLAAGTALTFADATYLYGVLTGGFVTGGPADFSWILAFGLFACGARFRRTTHDVVQEVSAGSRGWLIPYLAVVPATGFGVLRLWNGSDRFVLAATLGLVVLAMFRQFIALDDHRRLLTTAERQRELLDQLAHVDPLTGLENRRRFSEKIGIAVRSSLTTGVPVVVAFVDLDHFKAVNDTLGHAAGDDLLRGVAERLRTCVREADCAARWGGDEFAVLVTDPGAEAEAVAGRVREALLEPFLLGGVPHTATASIGAVREDPRRLLARLSGPVGGDRVAEDRVAEDRVAEDRVAEDRVPDLVEALLAAADAQMYVLKRARREAMALDQ